MAVRYLALADCAEISRQPAVEPRRSIPDEAVEPLANRMEGMLARSLVDRFMRDVAGDAREAVVLNVLAQIADVGVAQRPWQRIGSVGCFAVRRGWKRLSQNRGVQHLVEREGVGETGIERRAIIKFARFGMIRPRSSLSQV